MTSPSFDHCSFILFGATGDLARRMLFPSLYHLHRDGLLPACVTITGAARSDYDQAAFRDLVRTALAEFVKEALLEPDAVASFLERVDYARVDADRPEDFQALRARVAAPEGGHIVFYLSTNPRVYGPICANLKAAGLATKQARVVLEKPLGHDLDTSQEINSAVADVFHEKAVFRFDHYLGKEAVQNLIALRFANTLFEPLWNTTGIDHVQITIAEQVGVEGRWSYYDEAGALRDMVQNHMLQLVCLIAMEPPSQLEPHAVRNEKVKVLRSLRPIRGRDVQLKTVRGQYAAGSVEGRPVPAYLEEEGARPGSQTETFVALRADIDNWRWKGVPFYLRTGKRLPYRYSEICIQFKEVPHSIFATNGLDPLSPNKLIIRLQPEEQVRLQIMNKVPGLDESGEMRLRALPLDLSLAREFAHQRRRIAYERLLLDAIHNNSTLFVRRDEVEEAWTWIDGIQEGWRLLNEPPKRYFAGTWGPTSSIALTERDGHSWFEG